MPQAFHLNVGMVDFVLQQLLVKIANRHNMAGVLSSTGNEDSQPPFDLLQISLQQDEGIVAEVVLLIRAEVVVRKHVRHRRVKFIRRARDVPGLAEQRAE